MLPGGWTAELGRERMAELHRQANISASSALPGHNAAAAPVAFGVGGAGAGCGVATRFGCGRHGVLDRAISSSTVGDAMSSS
jgi:hypothetical protein